MLYNVYTKSYIYGEGKSMAIINIRVDENLKRESEKIFSELGLGMTAALTIFLKAVVRNKGIPFSLEIPNKKTAKAFKEADKIIAGKTKSKKYSSAEELRKDMKV